LKVTGNKWENGKNPKKKKEGSKTYC